MKHWKSILAASVLVVSGVASAGAAELIVLTGMGSYTGVRDIAAGFEKATGHKVTVSFETGPSLNQKLGSNAPADLFAGGPEQVADLTQKGKLVAGSGTPFTLAGLGVAVKAGAPRPNVSTVEAFKAAMLAAKSIGYSRGCSGTHAAEIMEKLGIAEQIKSKVVLTGGGPVAEYVAKGDFELGIQQTNVMLGVAGSDYIGHIPAAIDKPCPFSVALMGVSKQPDLARQLIQYMISPAAVPLLAISRLDPAKS
jgi:molybdate transport system substrate-binding protein